MLLLYSSSGMCCLLGAPGREASLAPKKTTWAQVQHIQKFSLITRLSYQNSYPGLVRWGNDGWQYLKCLASIVATNMSLDLDIEV